MRWNWIDRIVTLEAGRRIVAVKNISRSEEHLGDHFPADEPRGLAPLPVMPGSLVIEGMAQSAGVLVGHMGEFKEKVVLAKINRAELTRDAVAGTVLRYTATIERYDALGAATAGVVEVFDPARPEAGFVEIGRIDLMFSHIDRNRAGTAFPEHNFVFSDSFRTLLKTSGIEAPF